MRDLRRENLAARHGGYRQEALVNGISKAWQTLETQIAQVAPVSAARFLIRAKPVPGKEVVAPPSRTEPSVGQGPRIAINCGAVSRELLESELFGYEKGAFTGATTAKPGLIGAAEGSSLFLDEVGEMRAPCR